MMKKNCVIMMVAGLLLNTIALAGPVASGGGSISSAVVVCQQKRGDTYSSFSVSKTPTPGVYYGEYKDVKIVGHDQFARFKCKAPNGSLEFMCSGPINKRGEQLFVSVDQASRKLGAAVSVGSPSGQSKLLDRLPCEKL